MSLREAEGPPLVKGRENTREKQQAGGEGSGTERREPAGGSSSAAGSGGLLAATWRRGLADPKRPQRLAIAVY